MMNNDSRAFIADNNKKMFYNEKCEKSTTSNVIFQRSLSVRSSLRLLGSRRWKQQTDVVVNRSAVKESTKIAFVETKTLCKSPKNCEVAKKSNKITNKRKINLFHPFQKKNVSTTKLRSRNNLTQDAKQLRTDEINELDNQIVLQLPIDQEAFNKNTTTLLMNDIHNNIPFKFLRRSISLNDDSTLSKSTTNDQSVALPRTATIRRGYYAHRTRQFSIPADTTKISEDNVDKSNIGSGEHKIKKTNSIMEFLIPQPMSMRQGQAARNGGMKFTINQTTTKNLNNLNNIHHNIGNNMNNINNNNDNAKKYILQTQKSQQPVQIVSTISAEAVASQIIVNQQQQTKMTKKQLKLAQAQLNKLTQINIHLHALFSAVENGHLEKARTILESTDVDVNSLNSDGLSPLDVAVLSNNRSLTKMLLQYGAVEGSQFKSPDSLGNHLNSLLREAENRIHELGGAEDCPQTPSSTRASFSSIIGSAYSGPSVTGCTGTEADKQMGLWERRVKGLRRMLLGWDQARPPDQPYSVTIDVTSSNSVTVRIQESSEGPIATKYKIQWSSRLDFSNIVGEREVNEWNSFQSTMGASYRIQDLTQGRRYFFRANCGNVKGWGHCRASIPNSVIPSSWRDIEEKDPRFDGIQRVLDDLFAAVRLARPVDASDIPLETPALQRRNPKKKTTIKQLFSAASKFQKNLRRGIYLACILYHEDKVLVTNEDFLPVIEIDETYPSCLNTDYHWLMKVACTWDDVKLLRTDMDRNATSAVHFRLKLLTAACQMQSALCIQDLGQLFYKPLRDSHGTVVLSCINNVKSPKSVSVLNSRWIPLNKINKKLLAFHEDNHINEILLSSIQEQINYNQLSTVRLTKGLYFGYLKMQSSVDQIQIVVPTKTPNILPHCKIRDNPHISAEEWEFLRRKKNSSTYETPSDRPTDVQQLFVDSLILAAHRLLKYMDISAEHALAHRLYDTEVIELSPEVSFLIICPPAGSSCAVPGQREILLQRGDLISLPIQAFELIHLKTYHIGIIQKYSRLSCILELDTVLANHSLREAFSTVEVQAAKERLSKLQELTKNLNAVWKGVRWLMDVIGFARDRYTYLGLNMKEIFEFSPLSSDSLLNSDNNQAHNLLQPPVVHQSTKLIKSSPGRGSWPGPTHSLSTNGLLCNEHSKSEQQLSLTISNLSNRYLSATSGFDAASSRKNSADSNCSHSGTSYYSAGESVEHIVVRLPPSRSEDTLNVGKKHDASPLHRKRATTVNSSVSSTTSPVRSTASGINVKSSTTSIAIDEYLDNGGMVNKRTVFEPNCDADNVAIVATALTQKLLTLQNESSSKRPLLIADDIAAKNKSKDSLAVSSEQSSQKSKESTSSKAKEKSTAPNSSAQATAAEPSGIIQVYAAYETGLASGTSLKLHVTPKTSAREVVDLVVKQFNMTVVLKGKDGPIYTGDKLDKFCLVAVIGARERCLRDDFKPLQLQNPWKKGRLYVRQKHDLLAAIEHSNRDAQLI